MLYNYYYYIRQVRLNPQGNVPNINSINNHDGYVKNDYPPTSVPMSSYSNLYLNQGNQVNQRNQINPIYQMNSGFNKQSQQTQPNVYINPINNQNTLNSSNNLTTTLSHKYI